MTVPALAPILVTSVSLISVITTSESGNEETRGQREHFGHLPTVLMS